MAKRKSTTSPSSPRKKARLDLPTDTPSLEISSDDGASSLSASTLSPPTPERRQKRKRADIASSGSLLEESDTRISAKRARTQSPASSTRHSRNPNAEPWPNPDDDPDFVPWPSHFDDPQSQAHIYYEDEYYTKELTAEAREFRKRATLAMQGYLLCPCGKYHQMDGRKSWHHPGMEPELEEPVGAQTQPDIDSTYRSRSREPLLSPELSDDEETDAAEGGQLEIAPDSVSETSSISSDSLVPTILEASNVSPTISLATSPATSSASLPTTTEARVSRQRSNAKRNVGKPISQRQTRKKNKRKMEEKNKDKDNKRQPRGRRTKTTPAIEESVDSRRSSRRAVGSQLWFLGDNGKACLVTSSSK